ncbi:hypothetical protein CERZMDRAFT_101544 [Cercospora zeae-maydis SCOH1-5]|uniref:Uncharacterized protein n=1 Tax=Cercospora zeae-maydis SCOH1-5 TaxID=717836 RepID=A0A6A6F7B9_9PEZI|nr:hypothetical protein CERZMDRAFT_101544 [Cercospora zeae-maydis SCOH1-5]
MAGFYGSKYKSSLAMGSTKPSWHSARNSKNFYSAGETPISSRFEDEQAIVKSALACKSSSNDYQEACEDETLGSFIVTNEEDVEDEDINDNVEELDRRHKSKEPKKGKGVKQGLVLQRSEAYVGDIIS